MTGPASGAVPIFSHPRRRLVLAAVGIVISILAAWLAIRGVDLGRTVEVIGRAEIVWLALAIGVIAAQTVVRAVRWRLLLPTRPGAGGRIPLSRILPVTLVGYLGNAVLPARLGEPVRAALLARREGISGGRTLGSVLLERVVDTVTLAMVGITAAVLLGAPGWMIRIGLVGLGISLFALIALAVAAEVVARGAVPARLVLLVPAPLRRPGSPVARLAGIVVRIVEGGGVAGRPLTVLGVAGLSLGAWALDATIFWLVARSVGVDLLAAGAALVSAVTVLTTAVPSAPGYIGTFELAATSAAGALGVSSEPALAFALVAHAVTLLPIALAGVVALWFIARDSRNGPAAGMQSTARGNRS
jgi:glycosyltransferase 2 family protein